MKLKLLTLLFILFSLNTGLSQNSVSDNIPPDGEYQYDIAFAEWGGKSMGEKVTVIIQGESIKIICAGDGQLAGINKGEVIDAGTILKHKSGVWIIGTDEKDINAEEVGGCSGGPNIIDFEKKKFWTC